MVVGLSSNVETTVIEYIKSGCCSGGSVVVLLTGDAMDSTGSSLFFFFKGHTKQKKKLFENPHIVLLDLVLSFPA